jgi:beta-galactosidase
VGVAPSWMLSNEQGTVLAEGVLPKQDRIPTGQSTLLGIVETNLAPIAEARALTLEVRIGSNANDWTIWVYPTGPAAVPSSEKVRVTETLDADTLKYLDGGGRVLLLAASSPHTVPTDFSNPVWNPWIGGGLTSCGLLVDSKHAALAKFPTQEHSDWQWRDLLEPEARAFVLNNLPRDAELIAETIDEPLRAFRLGVLWEAGVGRGVLLATSLDLDDRPVARQLRRSLLAYLASDNCRPTLQLNAEQVLRVVQGDRFRSVDDVPAGARVMLDVEASVHAPANESSPWKAAHDQVGKQEPGFSHAFRPDPSDPWKNVPRVSWNKNGHTAWMAGRFTLHLHCPADFTGTVYLQFRDADSGKAMAAVQSGRDAWYIGTHGGAGKWVALRVTPEDLKDGELEITAFKPAGGDTWSRAPRIARLVIAH